MNGFIATFADESAATRIMRMIERHCPRLMRQGGGALSRETMDCATRIRTKPELVARIVALGSQQRLNVTEIAREVGSTQSVVFKILAKHGLRAPDGRVLANRGRAGA